VEWLEVKVLSSSPSPQKEKENPIEKKEKS
jgi:hypothetical protein